MELYVGHASSFPYQTELYAPLQDSQLAEEHTIIFPHENSDELFDSKSYLAETCDLFVAEVSATSTGLGIELGWADQFGSPIVCVHRTDSTPSGAVCEVTGTIREYNSHSELLEIIDDALQTTA